MARYYYTDVRIVELMEDWHGIWGGRDIKTYSSPPDENTGRGSLLAANSESKWYIDPSCYEMLKIRINDVIEYYNDHIRSDDYTIIYNGCVSLYENRMQKIIQRAGKAFFMPEIEGD